jgi:ribonuclease D
MLKPQFTVKIVKDSGGLDKLSKTLITASAFAVDIETTDWWNRHRERIALIQIAYRLDGKIKVAVIDTLADFDLSSLQLPLEQSSILKIIHNAGFDAVRLNKHYNFNVAPVFDTMNAARRSGERKYSLKAQAEIHLGVRLDKSAQASDWSRRPLEARQLHYAVLDPFATLLLYENQIKRGLTSNYQLKQITDSVQNLLPLDELPTASETAITASSALAEESASKLKLTKESMALLGIIAELPTRYTPDALVVSVGNERVGLAGWIIDQRLGTDAEPDEETVKLAIRNLREENLIRITETRRLEATDAGSQLWQSLK